MNRLPRVAKLMIAASLAVAALPAAAQEWTRFRGPNGSGVVEAPGVPAQFTAENYNFNVPLPGTGHSSCVVWGDKVFLTSSDKDSAARHVLCLSATSGSLIWNRTFASHPYKELHKLNDYASSTPAVDEKHLYCVWSTPDEYTLVALDHDGKDVWRANLGKYTSPHGSGASPLIVGDVLIVPNDQEKDRSSIFGFDKNTGKKLWETPRTPGRMAASTPCVYKNGDGSEQVVFTSQMDGITGIDPKTGKVVWQLPKVFKYRCVGSPMTFENKVIGYSGEGPRGHEFVVVEANGHEAKIAYELKSQTPYVPTPVYKNGLLFVLNDTGTMTCYRGATGEQVWQDKIGKEYFASPICISDKIYCVSKAGEVTCLAAKDRYEPLGKSDLGEQCFATPSVSGGHLFLRTYTHLISVGK